MIHDERGMFPNYNDYGKLQANVQFWSIKYLDTRGIISFVSKLEASVGGGEYTIGPGGTYHAVGTTAFTNEHDAIEAATKRLVSLVNNLDKKRQKFMNVRAELVNRLEELSEQDY